MLEKENQILDVGQTISEYTKSLASSGYAESTRECYRHGLKFFGYFLREQKISDLKKVSGRTMTVYREKVMQEPLAQESKALKLRPVKRLFEYLVATHRLLINPAEGLVETCRKQRKPGVVLTLCETKKLLAQPNLSLRHQVRDRAIMEVLYGTAIRLNELVSLRVHDVNLAEQTLYIHKGKGGKQRFVPLGERGSRYLREYLEQIRPHYNKKDDEQRTLFLTQLGLPMKKATIQGMLRQYGLAAGIEKNVSPHTLRRTCATHMLQGGADIRYIQELLGHADLRTTQFYTKIMPVEVKRVHETTHPGRSL